MSLPWKYATLCLIRRNGKTLFIDYRDYPHPIHHGFYAPPGGKIEPGENPEETTKREIEEETHIFLGTLAYRGVIRFDNERRTLKGKPFRYNFQVYIYECSDFDDSHAQPEEGRLFWAEDSKVLTLPLHEGDRELWKWLEQYQEIEGTVVEVGEQL